MRPGAASRLMECDGFHSAWVGAQTASTHLWPYAEYREWQGGGVLLTEHNVTDSAAAQEPEIARLLAQLLTVLDGEAADLTCAAIAANASLAPPESAQAPTGSHPRSVDSD
jgi:hypothetical protein